MAGWRKGLSVCVCALGLALALAGCGGASALGSTTAPEPTPTPTPIPSNYVALSGDNFVRHQITIHAGTAVRFDDSEGNYHQLCLGTDMRCISDPRGPKELQGQGFAIGAPQVREIVFPHTGTFSVTCAVHPNMNLTVVVH